MKTILNLLSAGGCALLFLASPMSLPAQQTNIVPPLSKADLKEVWQRRVKEVHLAETSLGEVVKILRTEFFPEVNFVLAPELRDMTITGIQLRSVGLEDIFNAIKIVTKGKVEINHMNGDMVSFTRSEAWQPKPLCQAFNIGRFLAGRTPEEVAKALKNVESAFDLCWKMLEAAGDDAPRPQFSIHSGTQLLIAVGTPEQMLVIEQVIGQLGYAVAQVPAIAPPPSASTNKPASTK